MRTLQPTVAALPDPYWTARTEALFAWVAAQCAHLGHERVCVAGSRDGYGCAILAAAGLSVLGVDRDAVAVATSARNFPHPRIEFRRADARRVWEPAGAFDAVIVAGLLEHVDNPGALLAEARRLCSVDGMVVAWTVNRLCASPGRTRPIQAAHAWEFTPDELGVLASSQLPGSRVLGLYHGRRLKTVERVLGAPIGMTLRLLPAADRAMWLRAALRGVSGSDFRVEVGALRRACELVAVSGA